MIPFTAGGFPGAGRSCPYAPATTGEPDTVHPDGSHGSMLPDSQMKPLRHPGLPEGPRSPALPAPDSRDAINAVAQTL
nr:hypothetical protein OG409_08160 [Streptomyces sp. NBC_00974]